jgi:pre-mRNA-splicing factor SYF1
MPGELLPTMAKASVAQSKLLSRKPELYLIVSEANAHMHPVSRDHTLTRAQSEEDAVYEQDILQNPGTIKPWLTYIDFKFKHGNLHEQAYVLERACRALPRSYKLWKMVCSMSFDLGSGVC